MHCSADFEEPVEADGGRVRTRHEEGGVRASLERGDVDGVLAALDDEQGPTLVGLAAGLVALVSLGFVVPATLPVRGLTALAVGYVAADRPTVDAAVERGAQALAVAPVALLVIYTVRTGITPSLFDLLQAGLYAGLVLFVARRL